VSASTDACFAMLILQTLADFFTLNDIMGVEIPLLFEKNIGYFLIITFSLNATVNEKGHRAPIYRFWYNY
jgi:hypothetical protein